MNFKHISWTKQKGTKSQRERERKRHRPRERERERERERGRDTDQERERERERKKEREGTGKQRKPIFNTHGFFTCAKSCAQTCASLRRSGGSTPTQDAHGNSSIKLSKGFF